VRGPELVAVTFGSGLTIIATGAEVEEQPVAVVVSV